MTNSERKFVLKLRKKAKDLRDAASFLTDALDDGLSGMLNLAVIDFDLAGIQEHCQDMEQVMRQWASHNRLKAHKAAATHLFQPVSYGPSGKRIDSPS